MRAIYRILLLLEVLVCFTPVTLMLLMGVLIAPTMLASMVMARPEDIGGWVGVAWVLGSVLCGSCGLVALGVILTTLLGAQRPIARPALTLAGAALGVLPIVPFVMIPEWGSLSALAPIAATMHLIYLSRRMLFPRLRAGAHGRDPSTSVAARRTKEACTAR